MRQAIAWSYDLLPANVQSTFQCLAIFVGGFRLDAARAVCETSLDQVTALVDQSLLLKMTSEDEPRCAMLETIREFALEQLAQASAESGIRDRHAEWCLEARDSARAGSLRWSVGQVPTLRRLEEELPNFRAAFLVARKRRAGKGAAVGGGARQVHWLSAVSSARVAVGWNRARARPEAPATLRAWGLLGLPCVAATNMTTSVPKRRSPRRWPWSRAGVIDGTRLCADRAGDVSRFFTGDSPNRPPSPPRAKRPPSRSTTTGKRTSPDSASQGRAHAGNLVPGRGDHRDLIETAQDEEVNILSAALHDGGTMRQLRGDHADALSLFARALHGFRDRASFGTGDVARGCGGLRGESGQGRRAVYLFGAAAALREWLTFSSPPPGSTGV